MRKLLILTVVAGLTICMIAGCGREAKEPKTYTGPEQVINIGINEDFVIALDSWEEVRQPLLWYL